MKRSQNCCYCEKPHGKSSPLVFQSCDACQDERDKREIAASNGLVSVSCPRCDLMFSADVTPRLSDAEREALEFAIAHGETVDAAWRYALRGLLERLSKGTE